MPLAGYTTRPVQAPAWAGVGLRAVFRRQRRLRPPCAWPGDWWQRDYDTDCEPNAPDPCPLTERQMRVPGL